jgi:hypothetical protein
MIDKDLMYQGKIPLDYHYILNFFKNEGQEGKINLFWRWVPVGRGFTRKREMVL